MRSDLQWMWSSLKSFVFIRRGNRSDSDSNDYFVTHFCLWILYQGNSIENFWIDDKDAVKQLSEETFGDHACIKSVLFIEPDFYDDDVS